MSALKAEACPALDKAAVPMREARPQGAPPLLPHCPRPAGTLTCEAAGLAGAHGAEQSQQGQPEGPEHGGVRGSASA